ncbi:MAG TPA: hypothetical protein VEH84_01360 [Alphaproteobacteria bacterium]|nr:hypothetical protein [Alphaproteobacteria bacterium]
MKEIIAGTVVSLDAVRRLRGLAPTAGRPEPGLGAEDAKSLFAECRAAMESGDLAKMERARDVLRRWIDRNAAALGLDPRR